ncbi:MAG: hypothetical protein GXP31_10105 [Kiritimatiellaeota bacterium]|nr:hypothetical protein [Kiritimatiellota bacterium]
MNSTVAWFVFLFSVGVFGAAENLAPNPGFEGGITGTGQPEGWWRWGGPGAKPDANLQRDTANPHSGKYCAKVCDRSPDGNFYAASRYVPVEPGGAYALYVWARGKRQQRAALFIGELDAQKRFHRSTSASITLTPEWQEFCLPVSSLRDDTRFVQLCLEPTVGQWSAMGCAWFDDVRFEQVDDRLEKEVLEPRGDDWFPFPMDWRDGGPSPIDVTKCLPVEKTGTHGFLQVRRGHFVFQDGTRARFWATNIHASRGAFPTRDQAETAARRLARLGVNMVRLHLLEYESPGGLIDASGDTTDKFDPERLRRLDYLLSRFHENGIYVTIDALPMCARVFRKGDRVAGYDKLGRGAGGISYFNSRIIELEHEYARRLLLHRNPYRQNLRYVDDPTIALLEMTNEGAPLIWWSWKHTPPYKAEAQRLWNQWLLQNVGTREQLRRHWTVSGGACGLGDDEDPSAGTVRVRQGTPAHPLRRMDYQRFLAELQRRYFADQMKFLRGLGVKVPVTGTNIMASPAMMSSCTPLDFTDNHAYWDHPRGGKALSLTDAPMIKADPLETRVLPVHLAMAKVAGRPAVATEWNSLWPNRWRAADTLMVPAYAMLNDLDIVYVYSYIGGWGMKYEDAGPRIPHPSVIYSDPAQPGLFPVLALMVRRGDIRPGRNLVEMGLSDTDTYLAKSMFTALGDFQHFVPLLCRWQSRLFDKAYKPGPGVALTVSSGFSASGDYGAAKRLLLWSAPSAGPGAPSSDPLEAARRLAPLLRRVPEGAPSTVELRGELPVGAPCILPIATSACLDAGSLPSGWQARLTATIGAGKACLFADSSPRGPRVSLAPGAGTGLNLAPDLLARWFTDAGRRWGVLRGDAGYHPDTGEFVSDTEELRWTPGRGLWICAAPRLAIVAGFPPAGKPVAAGPLTVTAETRFGAYSLISLDGASLTRSRRLLLAAVGRAENTGQKLVRVVLRDPGKAPRPMGEVRLVDYGKAPVLVQGLTARVALKTRTGPWRCWALGPAGRRRVSVPVTWKAGVLRLDLGPRWQTIYYELTAR